LHRELNGKGLTILAVSIEEPASKVAAWTRKAGLPFSVYLDEDGAVMRAWNVSSTPTVYLVNRQGRVVGRTIGNRPWTSPAGRALFAALLAP
jgi:peroxiredoxin